MYDVTLKKLLLTSADSILGQTLGHLHVSRWLNVELLPPSQTRHADLLGETDGGGLAHIELQSSNDSRMAFRMADYSLRIYDRFGKFPKQLVLYVGASDMRMPTLLKGPDADYPDVLFQYSLFDFKDLDGTILLASAGIEDNLLSILARLRDQRSAVQEILSRIADQEEFKRRDLLANFLVLSGLRKLADTARTEARRMPILTSILDHEVIGPAIRQGRAEGRAEGLADVSRRLLHKRFGPLPAWAIPGSTASLHPNWKTLLSGP